MRAYASASAIVTDTGSAGEFFTGVRPIETAHRRRAIENLLERAVIPRLLRANPETMSGAAPEFARIDVELFAETTLAANDRATIDYIERMVAAGAPIDRLYLSLLAPAARLLGERWTADTLDFVQVTTGMTRLQMLLHEFRPRFVGGASDGARRALIAPAPGEQHVFGPMMVADYFARAGWTTIWESNATAAAIARRVREDSIDLLGLSCASERHLSALERCIKSARRAARGRHLAVLVGGCFFDDKQHLATEVGADAIAIDGPRAIAAADRLVPARAQLQN
jgi:methanogenic corrinoid protein MtbC1